ncbi:MAG: hypothetical protein E6G17_09050 [Actinobacteria bacterium]|nr:MAG: hypothetical protein E6G17_09050 [Actinomycetota bacterium]
MATPLNHAAIEELLGAYALDAVDDDERDAVERHLAECPRCRAEVTEHREVAALLANAGLPAPDGLWDRLAGVLDAPPPQLALAPVTPPRRRRRAVVGWAAAAVAAAVVAVLGVTAITQGRRLDHALQALRQNGLLRAALAASTSTGARHAELASPDGRVLASAVLLRDGTGFLVRDDLTPLPADRTYQLWGIIGGDKISLGLLGRHPGVVAFRAAGDVAGFAVTAERAGGAVAPTGTPVIAGAVRSA